MPKYRIIPVGGGGCITPTGTLDIRSEGVFDVTDYASVDVDIFDDTTTKTITNNGTYNASDDHVLGYSQVTVDVPASAVDSGTLTIEPITQNVTLFTQDVTGYRAIAFEVAVPASAVDSGTKQITTNGNGQDVVGYASVDVNVPNGTETTTITANGTYTPTSPNIGFSEVTVNVPVPSGSVNLTQNRAYNVSSVAVAFVNVPASEVDTGTKQITANGSNQDVVGYAAVDVNVPASAVDSGTKQITSNGNGQDVIGYASVDVNVAPEPNYLKLTRTDTYSSTYGITLTVARGSGSTYFPDVYYSTDNKQTWTKVTNLTTSVSVGPGGSVYLKGDNPEGLSKTSSDHFTITAYGGSYSISGSLCSLLDSTHQRTDAPSNACFISLFNGFYQLTDAHLLELPTSIKQSGLSKLFYGCTGLQSAPDINILVIEPNGLESMFENCTALTTAPTISSTTAYNMAFSKMFKGCRRLIEPMDLTNVSISSNGATSTSHCSSMFEGCSSLVRIADMKWSAYQTAYTYMYKGCTSLTSVSISAPNTSARSLYGNMFEGCTGITQADLTIKSDGSNMLGSMFKGCSNLSTIIWRSSSFVYTNATDWVSGVAATGDFYNLGGATIPTGTNGIPSGWTEHTSL